MAQIPIAVPVDAPEQNTVEPDCNVDLFENACESLELLRTERRVLIKEVMMLPVGIALGIGGAVKLLGLMEVLPDEVVIAGLVADVLWAGYKGLDFIGPIESVSDEIVRLQQVIHGWIKSTPSLYQTREYIRSEHPDLFEEFRTQLEDVYEPELHQ